MHDTSKDTEFSGEFYFISNLFWMSENDVELAEFSRDEYSFRIDITQPKKYNRNGFSLTCSIIVKILIEDMLVDELVIVNDVQSKIITIVNDEGVLINKDDQTSLTFEELPQILELALKCL